MGDHYVVTGGWDGSAPEQSLSTVAKYSQSGLVEYLPSLNQRRWGHACSSFIRDSGETVGFIHIIKYQHFIIIIIIIIQVLLVTGGAHYPHPGRSWTRLDSTEILVTPGGSWRTLTTARLPSPRYYLRAGTANNVVYIFGENCLNVL